MPGDDRHNGQLLSYLNIEKRIGTDHPLHAIRELVNEALAVLDHDLAAIYAPNGAPIDCA